MLERENFARLFTMALRLVSLATILLFAVGGLVLYNSVDPEFTAFAPSKNIEKSNSSIEDPDKIEDGIHVRTGLIDATGLMTVVQNCTNCHSSKLIIQNRMNTERWNATIKWMQETQNLWPLGENQAVIVNYLVTNYPPKQKGRREKLSNIDWYELEN
ncbi:MAG: hypothetical protein JXR07_15545 [Reichenbachiella sp.]